MLDADLSHLFLVEVSEYEKRSKRFAAYKSNHVRKCQTRSMSEVRVKTLSQETTMLLKSHDRNGKEEAIAKFLSLLSIALINSSSWSYSPERDRPEWPVSFNKFI